MNMVAMGRAGLRGPRGKIAGRVAPPVARRTPLSVEQVEALIGALFLVLACLQFVRTMRRVWQAREEPG